MHAVFVVNPTAGHGRAGRLAARLPALAAAHGLAADVRVTDGPRHAVALARAAADTDVVVAFGGDGTVHEVAAGLVAAGGRAALGVLPVGTGNDFAKLLGLPKRVPEQVAAVAAGRVAAVDYGRIVWDEGPAGEGNGVAPGGANEAAFFNAVGLGFDGLVSSLAPRYKKLPGGVLPYVAAVVAALRRWAPPEAVVEADGTVVHAGPLQLVTVANGVSSGGGFYLTPGARVDDGRLDVCTLRAVRTGRLLRLLPRALLGRHVGAPEVTLGTARTVDLRFSHPVVLHADGEVQTRGVRAARVAVVPGGLRVVVGPRWTGPVV